MDKSLFVESIEAIKQQYLIDIKVAEHLCKAFPDAFSATLLPNNNILNAAILKILKTEMNDVHDWIEYFIWELDFGKENNRLKVFVGQDRVSLSTPEELYYFLKRGL